MQKRLPLVPVIEGRHVMIQGDCDGGKPCVLNAKVNATIEPYFNWVDQNSVANCDFLNLGVLRDV